MTTAAKHSSYSFIGSEQMFNNFADSAIDETCRLLRDNRDDASRRAIEIIRMLHETLLHQEACSAAHLDCLVMRVRNENAALKMELDALKFRLGGNQCMMETLPGDVRGLCEVLEKAIGFITLNPDRSREAVVKIQKRLDDYLKETGDE